MAYADLNRPAVSGFSASSVAQYFSVATAWLDARATRKALNKLTDRQLEDVGLQRADIDGIAQRNSIHR